MVKEKEEKTEVKELLKKEMALVVLAKRLKVNAEGLKATLKATVIKDIKMKNGEYRKISDAEFIAFIIVANAYKLNPLTKEIFAYPDAKSGGIIPVVSTDGWNKLMTTHPKYKAHRYEVSDNTIETEGAKPCPEWMEIHIEKIDGSTVIIREYLDECYNGGKGFSSPWDTHTKRMLRHKTKIQGAREAFGFGGIYDKDEAERIDEGKVVETEGMTVKPEVEVPKISNDTDASKEYKGKDEDTAVKEKVVPDGFFTDKDKEKNENTSG